MLLSSKRWQIFHYIFYLSQLCEIILLQQCIAIIGANFYFVFYLESCHCQQLLSVSFDASFQTDYMTDCWIPIAFSFLLRNLG